MLYYHLVLVVKYRRNVFDDDMSDYAKDMFWSRNFCLLTTGGSPIDVVKTYIENQSEK
ncbi:TPA: transposase [Bacillus thuringiensis]|nr:transposase [Bacillus thuringiensis]